MDQAEADAREQQRERDGQRHDQRAAGVPQKHEENDRHQQNALGQVVEHRVGGEVHQVAAVEKWNNLHARRQDVFIQFLDLVVNGIQGRIRIGALSQQHDAFHHVAVVDYLAIGPMNRLPDLAQADLSALCNCPDVFDSDRRPALRLDNRVLDVAHGLDLSDGANVDLLQAGFHKAAAGVHVVIGELLLDLPDAQPIGHQLVRLDAYLVLLGDSAEAHHVHDVGNGFELLFEHPVLERFQLHQVELRIGALQRVPIDLADRTVIRSDLRLDAVRKRRRGHPLQHFLPVPVVLRLVVENQHHAGEPE